MARFSYEESENYGAGKSSFFSLKDDKDTAKIRFLYNDLADIQGVTCHEVQVGDKRIDVECLRAYNEPVAKCPLCEANYRTKAILFVPVYDEDAKESKIWTRGKKFFDKLSSLCSRYRPLVGTPFEVERNGKKGDTSTTYELFPMKSDNSRIEDFPEVSAEGSAFQVKTFDELVEYLQTGRFSTAENDNNFERRNNTRDTNNRDNYSRDNYSRETPATPTRRRPSYNEEDNF